MYGRVASLIAEANRRRVFRTVGVYLVGIFAIFQGLVELAPLFGAPDWLLRAVLVGAVAFAPVVVILAWMFDIGRAGIIRDQQDVEREKTRDELSDMQTQIGPRSDTAAVRVECTDDTGNHSVVFVDDFYIGRAQDCRVRFYDPLVSRKHARVFVQDGVWRVADLGSRNGTSVNGHRVDAVELENPSEIRVNEAGPVLAVELIAPDEETTIARSTTAAASSAGHVRIESVENEKFRGPGRFES